MVVVGFFSESPDSWIPPLRVMYFFFKEILFRCSIRIDFLIKEDEEGRSSNCVFIENV